MTSNGQLTGLRFPQAPCPPEQNKIVTELDEEGRVKLEVIRTLLEPGDRSLFTPSDQKTRKERQKEEQAELPTQKRANKTEAVDNLEEEATATTSEAPQVEVLDYEELLNDYGF